MKFVNIERRGRISVVSFDTGSAANALSYEVMRELTAAARSFEDDAETSAVVLMGRGDNFSLGFDLKDPEGAALADAGLAQRRLALMTGGRMCRAWEEVQALTICAIEGWCVGGGAALAVSTDLRVAGARVGMFVPEIERGLNMSWGSVPRFTNLIGPAKTKRMMVLSEKVMAERAVDWGLVDAIAPDGGAVDVALEMAAQAATMPPVALRMCKQDIDAYANALARVASHSDFDQFALAQDSDDAAEGIASFLEKRDPTFTGR